MMNNYKSILLIEDSLFDYEAFVRAFKQFKYQNPIYHCQNEEEFHDFLCCDGKFSHLVDSPAPGLIILDLNLPGTKGITILEQIRKEPTFSFTPVVILSTSSNEKDVIECYQKGANSYVEKSLDMQEFYEILRTIRDY